ncbi:MAG TPA: hypothetical protein VD996_17190, partial [Chitinophagaceae bacterium]|nr:hypothetical protein [Chitinophagaceae bacterium]
MRKILPTLLAASIILIHACADKPANYVTGLKVYKEFDKSRKFDTIESSAFHYRPVKIDVFYPSTELPGGTSALSFADLMDMYEHRMNYNVSADSCRKVTRMLIDAIAPSAQLATVENLKTGIFRDLELPESKLPLIIYAAGMNGSSWENFILFDSLVRAGYVVAAISSVGLFPGFMSSPADLNEQVQDILFAKQKLSQLPFIDTSRIGLLSWSLGGSAITKAAMLSKDFKCLLSMDGTDIHYYGYDKRWDKDFDSIMQIAPFDPSSIDVPYMYLSGQHPDVNDSIYNLMQHVRSPEKYFLKFNDGNHVDFSAISAVMKAGDSSRINANHKSVCTLAQEFFDRYLKKRPGA